MDTQLEERRIVRRDEVSKLTGLAQGDDLQEGIRWQFPRAHPPWVARSVGWRLSEVVAWLQAPERRWDPTEVR